MVPTRHPTSWSNINVSLVTNRETEELIEELKNSPGTIEVLNFGEKGRGRNISKIFMLTLPYICSTLLSSLFHASRKATLFEYAYFAREFKRGIAGDISNLSAFNL